MDLQFLEDLFCITVEQADLIPRTKRLQSQWFLKVNSAINNLLDDTKKQIFIIDCQVIGTMNYNELYKLNRIGFRTQEGNGQLILCGIDNETWELCNVLNFSKTMERSTDTLDDTVRLLQGGKYES